MTEAKIPPEILVATIHALEEKLLKGASPQTRVALMELAQEWMSEDEREALKTYVSSTPESSLPTEQ